MKELITSFRLVLLSMAVCCLLYPAVVLAFGRIFASDNAEGSLVRDGEGKVVGSALLAQAFTMPQYFWPRPSAVNYDASATGGSNLSPANPQIAGRAREIVGRHGLQEGQSIPADLVTASGSGMDPHITLAAARFQAPRVAAARGIPVDELQQIIDAHWEVVSLRVFGDAPVVNVLALNLALDARD